LGVAVPLQRIAELCTAVHLDQSSQLRLRPPVFPRHRAGQTGSKCTTALYPSVWTLV